MTHQAPAIAALTVYPLKSAAGIEVSELSLDERGAVGDRRWLLVDPEGCAITAREAHALLSISPSFDTDDRHGALRLDAPGMPTFAVPVPDRGAVARTVFVWNDATLALDVGAAAAEWCSTVIGRACRLVYLDPDGTRPLKPKYAGPVPHEHRHVAFSDGAPLLVLGLSSIDALNERLIEQGSTTVLDRRRFRANVWVRGTAPHEEDTWQAIAVGGVTVGMGSLCLRCVLTTVDPDTREQGAEPLRTFASYRRTAEGVVFGVNATHAGPGRISVGDAIQVMSRREGVV